VRVVPLPCGEGESESDEVSPATHAAIRKLVADALGEAVADRGVAAEVHGESPSHPRACIVPVDSPPMTVIDDQGRPEPPLAADETTMLLAFLDYQRATLEWKTAGLDAAGLTARLAPSAMTLGGLL